MSSSAGLGGRTPGGDDVQARQGGALHHALPGFLAGEDGGEALAPVVEPEVQVQGALAHVAVHQQHPGARLGQHGGEVAAHEGLSDGRRRAADEHHGVLGVQHGEVQAGAQAPEALHSQVLGTLQGQEVLPFLPAQHGPVDGALRLAVGNGHHHRQAQAAFDEPRILHAPVERPLHHGQAHPQEDPQQERQGHDGRLPGLDGLEAGHGVVHDAGVADLPGLGHLELLGVVEQGGVEVAVHLHVAAEAHHLLLAPGQALHPAFGLAHLAGELGDLLVEGRHDVGPFLVGAQQVLPLLPEGGHLPLQAHALLEQHPGLLREVHGPGAAAVLVEPLLGHLQLALELGHLLLDEGQGLGGLLGLPLDVLLDVLVDDLVEDLGAADGVPVLVGKAQDVGLLALLGDAQVPAQVLDGLENGLADQEEGLAGGGGQAPDLEEHGLALVVGLDLLAHLAVRDQSSLFVLPTVGAVRLGLDAERPAPHVGRDLELVHQQLGGVRAAPHQGVADEGIEARPCLDVQGEGAYRVAQHPVAADDLDLRLGHRGLFEEALQGQGGGPVRVGLPVLDLQQGAHFIGGGLAPDVVAAQEQGQQHGAQDQVAPLPELGDELAQGDLPVLFGAPLEVRCVVGGKIGGSHGFLGRRRGSQGSSARTMWAWAARWAAGPWWMGSGISWSAGGSQCPSRKTRPRVAGARRSQASFWARSITRMRSARRAVSAVSCRPRWAAMSQVGLPQDGLGLRMGRMASERAQPGGTDLHLGPQGFPEERLGERAAAVVALAEDQDVSDDGHRNWLEGSPGIGHRVGDGGEEGRGGQDQADHAVPADQGPGVHIDHVAGLQGEAVGQHHGHGVVGVQLEDVHVVLPLAAAEDVDGAGVGGLVVDAARVRDGLGQGDLAVVGRDRARVAEFPHHVDGGPRPGGPRARSRRPSGGPARCGCPGPGGPGSRRSRSGRSGRSGRGSGPRWAGSRRPG